MYINKEQFIVLLFCAIISLGDMMKKLIIEGGRELSGKVRIGGAKNSVVALMPATVLTRDICTIDNVPDISDVQVLIKTMEYLGSKITYKDEKLIIDNRNFTNKPIPDELANQIRASYYFMGALLSKYHHAEMAAPGGCVIGARPIDYHLNSFKKMGVDIKEKDGMFIMDTKKMHGAEMFFDIPSVGATINVILAAVLAEGKTIITNAAREPEIANVASFLNSMGACITGAGTSTIEIIGVKELHGGYVETIPDRIEAGTYVIMGALLGKNFEVCDVNEEHIRSLLYKLGECGVNYKVKGTSIIVNRAKKLKGTNITTTVYPGFPTDLGQPMSTFLTQCEGESLFTETIYENRLRHVPHLNSMGANIRAFDKQAIIVGKTQLKGNRVKATDLRAGASMLVAGMIASGKTVVYNIEHLLRGYERLVEKLNEVGAKIEIVDE